MVTWRGVRMAAVLVAVTVPLLGPVLAAQPPTTAQQSEFVPISELPPGDQLPAAPLLVGAYAFVWIVLLAYLWSIGSRIRGVRAEIDRLERRLAEASGTRR